MSPMTEQLPKVKHEEVAEFILRVHASTSPPLLEELPRQPVQLFDNENLPIVVPTAAQLADEAAIAAIEAVRIQRIINGIYIGNHSPMRNRLPNPNSKHALPYANLHRRMSEREP